jgi:25S rRNA (adenine2142-N1)-methyltransferase
MGRIKPRRRKQPVTTSTSPQALTTGKVKSSSTLIQRPASSSSSSARALIRRFHVLYKKRDQLQKALELPNCTTKTRSTCISELSTVEEEILSLGGLERYQAMSSLGQGPNRGGSSAKRLIYWLKGLLEDKSFNIEGQRRFRYFMSLL